MEYNQRSSEPVKVVLPFQRSPYLGQIYAGLQLLEQQQVVELHWTLSNRPGEHPILRLEANGHVIVFDLLDGFNWPAGNGASSRIFDIHGSSGSYFKRSYNDALSRLAPPGWSTHALGPNYPIRPLVTPVGMSGGLSARARASVIARRVMKKDPVDRPFRDYELSPNLGAPRVLFATRLWDPNSPEVESKAESDRRIGLNKLRVEAILACREEFGSSFTGGIQDSKFSRSVVPTESLLKSSLSRKSAFLASVAAHQVCVTSLGLHGSTGWRFGEFVAGSRAILSESMIYRCPGLNEGKHYVSYSGVDHLIETLRLLLSDEGRRSSLMRANQQYYREYVRPDMLVRRALTTAGVLGR